MINDHDFEQMDEDLGPATDSYVDRTMGPATNLRIEGGKKLKSAAPTKKTVPLTEDKAALKFANQRFGQLLFCHDTKMWYEWSGTVWTQNRVQSAFHWARELVRELSQNEAPEAQSATSKYSFASAVERFCRADPAFAVNADVWDLDPWLLGTPDGTVDLRSGELREANPLEKITKTTSIGPNLNLNCPVWLDFLNEATGGDVGIIRFLQQWSGYALTGITREHALVFVHGPGGNGKSVFINIISGILGTYAKTAAIDTFTASKFDKHSTDMAMLQGARLVTASETEDDRAWAEARIKSLTGGDPITARFMRRDNFTFKPTFKLTIIGNHQPKLRNVDAAARRRFNIIPFNREPVNPDSELEEKLRSEWPAIFRWMIEGCLDWQLNGLIRPESILNATENYFSEQDLMAQWLADKCSVRLGDNTVWDRTSDLFESWSNYSRAAGETPGSVKSFGPAMQRKGFTPYRTKDARGFAFVRLRLEQSYGHGDG